MSTIPPVLPRFLSTLILVFCAARTTFGNDPWTGKSVLTRKANVAFRTESGQVGTLKDYIYQAREYTDDKLLVKDIDGTQGWANRADFVAESDALETFTQQLRSEPSAVAYHRRALAWYRKHDIDIALKDLQAAIGLDSKAAYAHQLKGLIHGEKKEYYDALSSLNLAIRLDPYNATAYRDRGTILVKMGNETGARRSFSQAARIVPTYAEAYLLRAEAIALERWRFDFDEAVDGKIADLSEAIRADPSYAEAYRKRGLAFSMKSGSLLKALADFDQAIRLRPDFALAYLNRGNIHSRLGKHDRAVADLGEAIRFDPASDLTYFIRADWHEQQGKWAEALNDYNSAIRLKPSNAHYFLLRSFVHRELGNLAAAEADDAEHDRLNAQERHEPSTYIENAKDSLRIKAYDDAIQSSTRYLTGVWPDPFGNMDYVYGYQIRGEAYLGKKEFDRAISDFTSSLAFRKPPWSSTNMETFRCRAVAYEKSGRIENAIADLTVLVQQDPPDAAALFQRATLYDSTKRYAWAIADLEKALRLRPDWNEAVALLEKVRVRRSAEGDDPSTQVLRLNHATKSFDVVYAVTLPHRTYLLNSTVTGTRECYLTGPTGRLSEAGRPAVFLRPGSVLRGDRIGGPADRYYRYSEEKTWKRSEPPEIYHFQEDIAGGEKYTELPALTDDLQI